MGVQFQISDSLGKNLSNDKTITAFYLERMSHQFDVKIQKLKIIFILTFHKSLSNDETLTAFLTFQANVTVPIINSSV